MESSTPAPNATPVKPMKALPTRRIAFDSQLDLLRAYGAVGVDGKGVTNEDLAGIVSLRPSTASLVNTFFTDVGFIAKADRGNAPAPEVIDFQRAYQWDPETAATRLAPILEKTWFHATLAPKLAFNALTEKAAIAALGEAAAAEKHYYPELKLLLDFLEAAGLIARDNGMVTAAKVSAAPKPTEPPSAAPADKPGEAVVAPSIPTVRGGLPLLIQGLLEQLPKDRRWTRRKAEQWLELARLTFDTVYDLEPEDEDNLALRREGNQE